VTAEIELEQLVRQVASAIKAVDAKGVSAASSRTGAVYKPGIGPHTEDATVRLFMEELSRDEDNSHGFRTGVPYPGQRQKRCDLCFGNAPVWAWAIEVKMLRMMGDNGKKNDQMVTKILSPYPQDHSALTDTEKLVNGRLGERKAILIYGFDYPSLGMPMDPVIEAFELLARQRVELGPRRTASYDQLVHPVHSQGRVFAWEIRTKVP
jgi:hypothetical protein